MAVCFKMASIYLYKDYIKQLFFLKSFYNGKMISKACQPLIIIITSTAHDKLQKVLNKRIKNVVYVKYLTTKAEHCLTPPAVYTNVIQQVPETK